MGTINQIKQLAESDTPLLFFQCVLPSLGDTSSPQPQYWCTHAIQFNGQAYEARVLKHNLFDLQLSADDAMDGVSQLSLTLANADSVLSELNQSFGFKGSQLTVYFAFADLPSGTITTESTVLFRGIASDPDEITESALRLTFNNKLSLQRVAIPEVRVQRTCPWSFPATLTQRVEAKDGGDKDRYSRFYRCGYSVDVPGGVGNLDSVSGQPFTSCDGSRTQCQQRGMFDKDNSQNVTRRFGGFEFVPSAIKVRTSGTKASQLSPLLENAALYNDPVPLVYGTGWLKAPVIFARNDGTLTHMEVLLGLGTGTASNSPTVLKAVVNDVEIPQSVNGKDMTTTGWYSVVTTGARQGNFNPDFPLGDPYGSIAVLSVVVPNRICSGKSLPMVEVLLQGIGIDTYDENGTITSVNGPVYTNNPAWIILDILRRCGWSLEELNLPSFTRSAAYCDSVIQTTDLNGNAVTVARSQCNLILATRQSAAAVVRGIRVASSLMLRYGATGLLELVPEAALAVQQRTLPDGSNSTEMLNGGWPAYEFSDGTGPFSGIMRDANGGSSVRLSSRSIAETSNRLSVEFQDEANEYQQDSLSLVDADDTALIGYEISSQSTALGIPNFNQATRVLLRQLDKSTKGNQFIQFQTSFRALKIRPGDIITVTYAKEWLERAPFRVVKLSPSLNYQTVTVLAQVHDDDWYSDSPAVLAGAGRQPGSHVQVPRPLIGTMVNPDGTTDFGVSASNQMLSDGTALQTLTVNFVQPVKPSANSSNLPLVSLSSTSFADPNGTLVPNTYYYAISAVDANGGEGAISFTVPVFVPQGMNAATITPISFPVEAASFHVYRGTTPQLLHRIDTKTLAQAAQLGGGYSYTDLGQTPQPVGPPDPNFDHANFYFRYQYTPYCGVTASTATSVSTNSLQFVPSFYANSGRWVRIVRGTGAGQERVIIANDESTLTVNPAWSVQPDTSSLFAIVESSWKLAAVSTASPVQFQIPYQVGTTIQISGRAANVQNQESSADLCPMTEWNVSGTKTDTDVPGAPAFTLSAPGGGSLQISQVGFSDLSNTASVTSGTLSVFFWDELQAPATTLAADVSSAATQSISLAPGTMLPSGTVVQVDSELMAITGQSDATTNSYSVARGTLGTVAAPHTRNADVLILQHTAIVLPFERGFFLNETSVNYLHTVNMPDCRVLGAQLQMTNTFGNGSTTSTSYVNAPLRTLSGGQFALQVSGYLMTQTNAAPPFMVQATHAVRDIRANLGQAPQGYSIDVAIMQVDSSQNVTSYWTLHIPDGSTTSSFVPPSPLNAPSASAVSYVDGLYLQPLQKETFLQVNVTLNPTGSSSVLNPGKDLTVTIRF